MRRGAVHSLVRFLGMSAACYVAERAFVSLPDAWGCNVEPEIQQQSVQQALSHGKGPSKCLQQLQLQVDVVRFRPRSHQTLLPLALSGAAAAARSYCAPSGSTSSSDSCADTISNDSGVSGSSSGSQMR